MISKISSFGMSKISFGKLSISKDKETKKVMQNLRAADHILLGAMDNVDKESERIGYDVKFDAKMLPLNKGVYFQAYAYAKSDNKFVGYHCGVLEDIDKESDPEIYARNKDVASRFAYDFPKEVKGEMEAKENE